MIRSAIFAILANVFALVVAVWNLSLGHVVVGAGLLAWSCLAIGIISGVTLYAIAEGRA